MDAAGTIESVGEGVGAVSPRRPEGEAEAARVRLRRVVFMPSSHPSRRLGARIAGLAIDGYTTG